MISNQFRKVGLIFSLAVPFLTLLAPSWFSLMGVGPCWEVLWLLPWSFVDGPFSGALMGLFLGVILDAISLGGVTQIPVLVLLGLWWGRMGKESLPNLQSFSFGVLAWLGSVMVSLGLWLQFLLMQINNQSHIFSSWSFHTLLAQSILTGLLAPLVCSRLKLIFRKVKG